VKTAPRSWIVWFAVLGGAMAWTVQFVANLYFSFAQCDQPGGRWHLPVHGWEIGLSAAAVVVCLAAEATAVWVYRRTSVLGGVAVEERRGKGSPPPLGRIQFLAQVALPVNVLVLTIIVMTGVGAPLLRVCQQS
jgi:hypothetical protein